MTKTHGFEYTINTDDNTIAINRWSGDSESSGFDGTTLTIPETINGHTVTELQGFLWGGNSKAKNVIIPSTVTKISYTNSFNYCNIENIIVDSNNQYFSSEDGILFNKNKTELIRYSEIKQETTYTVPESVTTIKAYAFYGNPPNYYGSNKLQSINTSNVVKVEENAFWRIDSLISIEMPQVTEVEAEALEYCTNLSNVMMPKVKKMRSLCI